MNKPIPFSLLLEDRRLCALEHNTLVQYGFLTAELTEVPDPESERREGPAKFVAQFDLPDANAPNKRKCHDDDSGEAEVKKKVKANKKMSTANVSNHLKAKKNKESDVPNLDSHQQQLAPRPPSGGCSWSAIDWSCAYDSVPMSVFYAYMSFTEQTHQHWMQQTTLNNALGLSFDTLLQSSTQLMSTLDFNNIRDHLRNFLSNKDPDQFPRHGAVGAPADLIFSYMSLPDNTTLSLSYHCDANPICSPIILIPTEHNLPLVFARNRWTEWCSILPQASQQLHAESASIQIWVNLALNSRLYQNHSMPYNVSCYTGCNSICAAAICLNNPPPMLVIEVMPDTTPSVVPSKKLTIPGPHEAQNYSLRAVIYLGNFHYTTRMLGLDGNIWSYDGRKNGGTPYLDQVCTNPNMHMGSLDTFGGHRASIYIYTQ